MITIPTARDEHGRFLGLQVECLSQQEGWEERAIQTEPFEYLETGAGVYGRRTAYSPGGCRPPIVEQVLIVLVDTPHWINLSFRNP